MSLAAKEIREQFLAYFERNGHRRVQSYSLVPDSDPTLMFVNAGMVPFKRVFLGEESRDYSRATTSQKCMRVSGKHNDLENVGRTPRHHTFFEMLGNFSFGDYFKQEAIAYAWELMTEGVGFEADRLAISVFEDDDDAFSIWENEVGIPSERIYRLGASENFWSMGDTGPCGPCSEIHFDFGRPDDCPSEICDPACDCGRWMEVWNLVFMQFNRDADGTQTPLPKPSIDTGGGLERWAAVLQGKRNNYDSDLFEGILARAQDISGVQLGQDDESDVSLRVVADHARALSFLIGDGVLPSNAGRGYVLRRILRRASRHGVLLDVREPFVHSVADAVIDEMGGAYPDLVERRAFITDRIKREEERFLETLEKGLLLLEDEIAELKEKGTATLPGESVFKLYDTFGFPVDLTEDILRGHGMSVDQPGFDTAMTAQRERARAAWKGSGDSQIAEVYGRIATDVKTQFVGYDGLEATSNIAALVVGGEPSDRAGQGDEVEVVTEETPFYAESGGQVGDRGELTTATGKVEVSDTQKPVDGLFVHRGKVVEGEIAVDTEASLAVDAAARQATVRNHTGTHLLHSALREVLGPQAMQKGSLVGPERLRFDFTHDNPLTRDELDRIEDLVNGWIEENSGGETKLMTYDDAVKSGAIAIFDEKYGDEVRVVSFGEASTELCGGTHAKATGDIGLLKVVSETGVAAGVRRIEALTGHGALAHVRAGEERERRAAELLKAPVAELPERVEKLIAERRELERELEKLRAEKRGQGAGDLVDTARDIECGKALAAKLEGTDAKELSSMVDDLRNRLGSAVVALLSDNGGKVLLAVGVTKDLVGQYKAGDIVKELAGVVGGGGGGRPDFAQAGGKDASKIDDALGRFFEMLGAG